MNKISILGKFLDQPHLISNISKAMPIVLIGGASAYGLHDTFKAPKEKRGKRFIQNVLVLAGTVSSALIATRGLKSGKIDITGLVDVKNTDQVTKRSKRILSRFRKMLQKSPHIGEETKNLFKNQRINELLGEIIEKPLGRKKLEELYGLIGENHWGKKLMDKLIPPSKDFTLKESLGEIKRLSVLGAIPVIGGIFGGIAGCFATGERGKVLSNCVENKVKEGTYQYLANIVLCNVGATAALGAMSLPKVKNFLNSRNINNKMTRLGAMATGIASVGILGGSAIANFIGENILDKLFGDNKKQKTSLGKGLQKLYSERHPEILDAALHADDFATIGVLSGFKWIEPALPLMYSVSGYRAGMGYRNGEEKGQKLKKMRHHNNAVMAGSLMKDSKVKSNIYQNFLSIRRKNNENFRIK